MTILPYVVAGWLLSWPARGMVTSRNIVHSIVCLSVAQRATYVLLLAIGYRSGGTAPVFGSTPPTDAAVVDPVVQALTLTDVVVGAP